MMNPTPLSRGYIGIMEKKMETTIWGLGFTTNFPMHYVYVREFVLFGGKGFCMWRGFNQGRRLPKP